MREPRATAKGIAVLVDDLSQEELLVLQDTGFRKRLRRFLERAVRREKAKIFATPMADHEAAASIDSAIFNPLRSAERRNWDWEGVNAWRKLASEFGYAGPIAWQIRAGFTLKNHGSKETYCYEGWKHIQNEQLQNDEPTQEGMTFWIPRILPDSTRLSATEQLEHLGETRRRFELPEYHLRNFGPAALLTALIQSHFERTGERVPLSGKAVRTNALYGDRGEQLILFWGAAEGHIPESHFFCGREHIRELSSMIGVFPWGWATPGCKV